MGKLFISKPWVITIIALSYSLSPQFLTLKASIAVVELLAAALLPWALFFVVRALQAFNSARAWRWVGLLGLSLALLAASSSLVFGLMAATVVIAAISQPKRGLILIWSLLPGVAVLYPLIRFAIETQNWLAIASVSAHAEPPIQVLDLVNLVVLGLLILLALPTWFLAGAKVNFGFFGFAISALSLSAFQPQSSSAPLVLAAMLALLVLSGLSLERVRPKAANGIIALGSVSALLYSGYSFGFLNQVDPTWQSSRVMPALVVAASEQNPNLRTLVLDVDEVVSATYVWGSGQKLEMSAALLESNPAQSELREPLAEISANLIAGNQDKLVPLLSQTRIDFVLLRTPNPEVEVGISSLDILQPAGATSFGVLWRVASDNDASAPSPESDPARPWQFGVVAAFALLALPTRAAILGRRRRSAVK